MHREGTRNLSAIIGAGRWTLRLTLGMHHGFKSPTGMNRICQQLSTAWEIPFKGIRRPHNQMPRSLQP